MNPAKIIFNIAGAWGVVVLTPMYFLYDLVGRQDPPAITHPENYFGFVTVGLVWQIAFFVIATDPPRFRPMMIPAMLEKFGYVTAIVALWLAGRVHPRLLPFVGIDLVLGVLFVIAYLRTPSPPALAAGRAAETS